MAKIKSWPTFLLYDILLHLEIHDTEVKWVAKSLTDSSKAIIYQSYISPYFNI